MDVRDRSREPPLAPTLGHLGALTSPRGTSELEGGSSEPSRDLVPPSLGPALQQLPYCRRWFAARLLSRRPVVHWGLSCFSVPRPQVHVTALVCARTCRVIAVFHSHLHLQPRYVYDVSFLLLIPARPNICLPYRGQQAFHCPRLRTAPWSLSWPGPAAIRVHTNAPSAAKRRDRALKPTVGALFLKII